RTIVEPVEPFLEAVHQGLAAQVKEFDPGIAPYAEYALTGNGKHLRPTLVALSANSGNEVAVLFGDCLFAHALKLAASFPTPEICRAVASATNTVCSGEILQTQQRRNFQFSRAEYFKVLEMKTAELFALSCDLGA